MSYAEWMEKQKKTNTPSSSNNQPQKKKKRSYAEWMENQSSQTSVQKWLQNIETLIKDVQNSFKGYDSASMTDKESLTNRTIDLISVADEWKKRYASDRNAVKTIDSVVSMLKDTQKGIGEMTGFYSQFDTEDDYNSYMDAVKHQNKIEKLNIDKEELEIKALEQQLNDAGVRNTRAVERGELSIDDASKNLKDLEKALNEKKRNVTLAKRYNRSQELSVVTSASDFDKYSQIGAEIENPTYNEANFGLGFFDERPFNKDPENIVTFSRENVEMLNMAEKSGTVGIQGKSLYQYMTDEEVAIYNYYLGKGDKETADEYLDSLTDTLNYKAATAEYERLYKDNTAMEFLFSGEAGLDQFRSGMAASFSDADYFATSKAQHMSGMIREDLADVGGKLPEWMGGGSVGQMFYDIGTSTANMLPSILVGMIPGVGQVAAPALMGMSSGGNAYTEMINLGYDQDQSRLYAGMVGASEAGLQYVLGGISALGGKVSGKVVTNLVNKVDNALARTAIKLGGNMASEFTEEYLQEVLTPVYRNMAFNEENDIELFSEEALYAGFLGALTAGALEGGGTISGEISNYKTGKALDRAGIKHTDLTSLAGTFSADSVAYQLAGRVDENTGAYTLGRLFNEMGATLTEQNVADITSNLKGQGVDTRSANILASALVDVVNGNMSLTEAQKAALEANDSLSRAVVETVINPNSTEYQRTSNYYDMLESLAREMTAEPSVESVNDKTVEQTEKAVTEKNTASEDVDLNEALVQETIASMKVNPSAANILMENFKSPANKLSAEVYSKGIQEAYRYGSLSIPINDMMRNGAFSKDLSRHQRMQAYNLGEQAAKAKVAELQAKIDSVVAKKDGKNAKNINSKVHFDRANRKFNAQQESALAVMDVISVATGTDIYVFESYEQNGKRVYRDDKGNVVPAPNGFYDPKDGSIHLDLNAGATGRGTMLFTAAHEFTHKIKDSSPVKYKLLADTLMKSYASKGVSVDSLVQRQIEKAKAAKRELTYEEAYDEVIADSMESILQSGNVLETLAEIKQQDKSLWQAIVSFFKEFATKIKQAVAAYKGITPDSIEGRMIAEMKEFASELEQIYADALADVGNATIELELGQDEGISNEECFLDSEQAVKCQIRPPYNDGNKAFNEFVDGLNPEARQTFDLFYGFYQKSRITNALSISGKTVKKVNISSLYLRAQQWNDMLSKDKKWATAAKELAEFLPADIRERMGMHEDGSLSPTPLEEEFKMPSSLAQRLVDSLPFEAIEGEYRLGGKTITLPKGKARQSVGGEAYRRAILNETRKLFAQNKLRKVGIGTMSKDRWGSLGFLAANGKTGASGDFTTICPQMMFNRGCWYCYRRAALESGVNNKLVAQNVWYTGEILRIKDSDIEALNKNGGLRIQSFGDWMPHFSAMLADVLYDAELRGLQVKIITKEPSMINYIAALREQGIGKNLYFNLSADYTIEKAPQKQATNSNSLDAINPERPFMRDEDNTLWWKRAMTVEEASRYREKYDWVNTRIVAADVDEFIRGLKDSKVDVVTGYHGNIREYERVDSTVGEHKLNVEALGDAGMPRFTYNPVTNTWLTEYEGKTQTHKKLAQAIAEEGLQSEYYTKTCCITGRCSTCNGKCGALSRDFNVKNATNRDAESVAYWQKHMQYGIEPEFDTQVKYSDRDSEGHTLTQQQQDVVDDFVAQHKDQKKYSGRDSAYMDAIENGDFATVKKLVAEAAADAGYTEKLIHGTENFGFTKVNLSESDDGISFFATDTMEIAKTYSSKTFSRPIVTANDYSYKEGNYDLFANTDGFLEVDAKGANWNDISFVDPDLEPIFEEQRENQKKLTAKIKELKQYAANRGITLSEAMDMDREYARLYDEDIRLQEIIDQATEDSGLSGNVDTRSLAKYAKNKGYKGVKITNLMDDGGRGNFRQENPGNIYIFFDPQTQVKSADNITYDDNGNIIPLSERFNKKNNDIRYSGRGNGYDGYSMSNNARAAYDNEEMPLSKWNKSSLISAIHEVNPDIDCSRLTVDTLKNEFLVKTSWHHTSKMYNKTDFYSIKEDFVQALTQDDVDNIATKQTSKPKVNRDTSFDSKVDEAYAKIQVLIEAGIIKSETAAINRIVSGKDIEEAYNKAVDIIRRRDASKVEQWRKLPANHFRQENVRLYDENIHEYIRKTYLSYSKLSRNSKAFKKMAGYFAEQSTDIRYSDRDTAYMDAVNRGDKETEQRMVDEAARAAGYTEKAYHGTGEDFNIFSEDKIGKRNVWGKGFYFGKSKGIADDYASWRQNKGGQYRIVNAYLKMQNPFVPHKSSLGSAEEIIDKWFSDMWKTSRDLGVGYIEGKINNSPLDLLQFIAEHNKLEVQDVLKQYGFDSIKDGGEYVVFDAEQIKSADPVTYDDEGNVIPLSERFNSKNNDIRNSLRDGEENTIYIKDGHTKDGKVVDFANAILDGVKKGETRTHKSLTRKWVGIAKDGYVIGRVKLGEPVILRRGTQEYADSLIEGTEYDIKDGQTRYYYPVEEVMDFRHNPRPVLRNGSMYGQYQFEDNKKNDDIRYSLREPDSVSNRSLLANAFEGIAQNEIEQQKIAEYKSQVERLDAESQKLNDINKQIKELSFGKGARDTAKIKQLRDKATKTANRINNLDKKLLGLEASKPLQAVLQREKQKAYKRAEEKGRQALKDYRAQANERIQKAKKAIMEKSAESRKNAIERRTRKEIRHKIQKVVRNLNQFLLRPDKKKHVPINMQKAVAEALDIVNMDTVSADERVAKYDALIAKATDPEVKASLAETRDRIATQGSRMAEKLERLHSAYEEFIESDDSDIANAYDEVVSNLISNTAKEIGETPLRDMNLEQLESVYDMYKAVLKRVRDANRTFADNIRERISDIVGIVFGELSRLADRKKTISKLGKGIAKFLWNNLKPIYAFARIGSPTLSRLYENIRKGEETWGVDIEEAKAFSNSMKEKYGYKKWDKDKEYEFTSATDKTFTLNLEEMMSIYAYAKRESDIGTQHLRKGGFIYDDNAKSRTKKVLGFKMKVIPEDAAFHKLNDQLIQDIVSTMDTIPGVRDFVDEMQDYLSTVMGAKGNEVSKAMYDIKLFKEKNFFPLHVSSDYNARIEAKQKGEVKIKNAGFTKEINTKASAPIVLTPFMDVWAEHVNDMAMYHSFVLPLEDFYRVYNSNSGTSEHLEAESIKQQIKSKHGVAATGYVEQLLKDINGDVRSDPRESMVKGLVSGFKKAAVMASLSVVIQQPSSFARALSILDARDFMYKPSKLSPNKLWAEVKKYAPIAIIKEMGKFDTDVGQSTTDYIKNERSASSTIDKVLGTAPAMADQITWNHIWMAVKHEIARKNKDLAVGSEEFFKKAGERFTEVVTKTQVYDSVFSRSANMRSKNSAMQAITAFLAEPTTTLNMYQNAIHQSKMGYKKAAARTIASIYASIALNSALASVVYAMRDDDEDETWLEKYLQSFSREIADGVNPLTYYPIIKDVWSIAQGFTVERADMSMVQDLWTAIETFSTEAAKDIAEMDEDQLKEHDKAMITAAHDLAGAMSAMFGVPVGNIIREVKGGINMYNTVNNGLVLDATLLWDNVLDSVQSTVPVLNGVKVSKKDKLYEVIVSGDQTYIDRLKATYEDEDKYKNALRTALRENDPRVKEAAQARLDGDTSLYDKLYKEIVGEGNFDSDIVIKAINNEYESLRITPKEESSTKLESRFDYEATAQAAINGDTSLALEAKEDMIRVAVENGKTKAEATETFNGSFSTKVKEKFVDGELSASEAKRMLTQIADNDAETAAGKVDKWQYEKNYPELEGKVSYSQYQNWEAEGKPRGISLKTFTDVTEFRNNNGSTRDQEEVAAYIDSITTNVATKDALWLCFWKESTLYDKAPWHN